MAEQQMTLAQVEQHLDKANMEQFDKLPAGVAGAQGDAASLSGVLQKVCGVYKAVRPILSIIVNFPLLPEKIKNAVKTFMKVMDSVCP